MPKRLHIDIRKQPNESICSLARSYRVQPAGWGHRLQDLLKTARSFNMPAVSITDHGSMFGALEFYELLQKVRDQADHWLAKYNSPEGAARCHGNSLRAGGTRGGSHTITCSLTWQGITTRVQKSHAAGDALLYRGFYYKTRIDKELLRLHTKGAVPGSLPASRGKSQPLLLRNRSGGAKVALRTAIIFGPGDFYLEIRPMASSAGCRQPGADQARA